MINLLKYTFGALIGNLILLLYMQNMDKIIDCRIAGTPENIVFQFMELFMIVFFVEAVISIIIYSKKDQTEKEMKSSLRILKALKLLDEYEKANDINNKAGDV